jgi:hypothetical protein
MFYRPNCTITENESYLKIWSNFKKIEPFLIGLFSIYPSSL